MATKSAADSRGTQTKAKKKTDEDGGPAGKAEGKKAEGKKAGGKKADALQQPLKPSPELAAVVGEAPLPRTEVVKKVWDYIKSKNLQDPKDRRSILADEALSRVFGKDRVTMFEMNKHLARHLG